MKSSKFTVQSLSHGYDVNALSESGFYEVANPTNGPDEGNYLLTMMRSPRSQVNDLEAVQVAYDLSSGTSHVRAANNGTWGDWAAVGSGGGGGGASDAADVAFDPTAMASIFPVLTSYPDVATFLAQFGITATNNNVQDSLMGSLLLSAYVNYSVAAQISNIVVIVPNPGRPPTANDDVTQDWSNAEFDGVRLGSLGAGRFWLDTSVSPHHTYVCIEANPQGGARWLDLTNLGA